MAVPLALYPEGIPVLQDPGSLSSEHREATQRLLAMLAGRKEMLLVQIAGLNGGEGASTVATSLSRSLQHSSGRQIVHYRIAASGDSAKAGEGGVLTPATVRKLLAQGFREGLSKIASGSDVLVLETLPLLDSVESVLVGTHVDCVIIVAEGDRSTYAQLREAQQAIERAGGQLLGVIVNKRQYRIPSLIARLFDVPHSNRPKAGRWAVGLVSMIVAGALVWIALTYGTSLMEAAREVTSPASGVQPDPSLDN